MLSNNCQNYEVPEDAGICSSTPKSIKLVNQSGGTVTLMRTCRKKTIPYTFPNGTLDFIPSMSKSELSNKENVVYYLSHVNSSNAQGDNLPYVLNLFDPYNLQVSPNQANRNSPQPSYQIEAFQNNKKIGEVNPFSRPLFLSTTPGGIIIIKLVNSPLQPSQPEPTPQPPIQEPIPQPPVQEPILEPVPPEDQFGILQKEISATNSSILNSVNSLDNTLSTFGQSVRNMQNDFLALGSSLERSINNLTVVAQGTDDETKKSNKIWIWIGVGVAVIIVLILIGIGVYFVTRKKKKVTAISPVVEEVKTRQVEEIETDD